MTSLRLRLVRAALSLFVLGTLATGGSRARADAPTVAASAEASFPSAAEVPAFTRAQIRWMRIPGALLAASGLVLLVTPFLFSASDDSGPGRPDPILTSGAVALATGGVLVAFSIRRELVTRPAVASAATALRLGVSFGATRTFVGPSLRLAF